MGRAAGPGLEKGTCGPFLLQVCGCVLSPGMPEDWVLGIHMSCRLSGLLLYWRSTQGTGRPSQHPGLGVQPATEAVAARLLGASQLGPCF